MGKKYALYAMAKSLVGAGSYAEILGVAPTKVKCVRVRITQDVIKNMNVTFFLFSLSRIWMIPIWTTVRWLITTPNASK